MKKQLRHKIVLPVIVLAWNLSASCVKLKITNYLFDKDFKINVLGDTQCAAKQRSRGLFTNQPLKKATMTIIDLADCCIKNVVITDGNWPEDCARCRMGHYCRHNTPHIKCNTRQDCTAPECTKSILAEIDYGEKSGTAECNPNLILMRDKSGTYLLKQE